MAPPPPRNGIAQIVTGFILLPIGIIFVGASAVLWNDGCSNGRPCFDAPGTEFYSDAVGALVLDMFGIAFIIAGLVLIPVGFVHYARWRRWRDRQMGIALYDKNGLSLDAVLGGLSPQPAAAGAPTSLASGSFGLKLTF